MVSLCGHCHVRRSGELTLIRRQIRQVQIPDHGLKPPLTSLFRDGQLLWMKSRDGRAMPYRIKDLRAVAMQSAGQLAANTQLIELPLQRGELVWRGRGTAIIFRQPSSEKELVDSADAVLHLNPRQLLVAARDTIMLWTVGAAGPVLTQTYRQPGATVDLYLTGDTVIAVGQDYGVLTGRVVVLGN